MKVRICQQAQERLRVTGVRKFFTPAICDYHGVVETSGFLTEVEVEKHPNELRESALRRDNENQDYSLG